MKGLIDLACVKEGHSSSRGPVMLYDQEAIYTFLEPLKAHNLLNEYRYQLLNVTDFKQLFCHLEATYQEIENKVFQLEQKIEMYKNCGVN